MLINKWSLIPCALYVTILHVTQSGSTPSSIIQTSIKKCLQTNTTLPAALSIGTTTHWSCKHSRTLLMDAFSEEIPPPSDSYDFGTRK